MIVFFKLSAFSNTPCCLLVSIIQCFPLLIDWLITGFDNYSKMRSTCVLRGKYSWHYSISSTEGHTNIFCLICLKHVPCNNGYNVTIRGSSHTMFPAGEYEWVNSLWHIVLGTVLLYIWLGIYTRSKWQWLLLLV